MLSRWIWVLSLLRVITGLPVSAETLTGQVVGVHDGDTLTLRVVGNQPVKVRLAGLDAPELDQTYGQKAKRALSALAFGKEARAESPEPDNYGRTLGYGVGWKRERECGSGETGRGVGISGLSVSAGTGGIGSPGASGETGIMGIATRSALSALGLATQGSLWVADCGRSGRAARTAGC